jgi:type IV pilus assembly protein PilM
LTVAINISNQNIKITSGSAASIEKWCTLPVADGLIKDGLILEPETIGRQVKEYFEKELLQRKNITVSLSGASYVFRRIKLPHLPANRLREAVERATQKEVHLDLADIYIDWDILKDNGSETEVFVIGIHRRTVESVIQALHIAGIKPQRIEMASLSLARAAGCHDCLLVNFEPDCFDIVVVSGGIPVTLHSVLAKTQQTDLQDRITQLSDELTRTIDYYNLSHKEQPILPGSPLILTGSLSVDMTTAESLQKILGMSVSPIKPSIACPDDLPLATYSVNLGLALKKTGATTGDSPGERQYHDIDIDLLRGRQRAKATHISYRQILIPAGLTLAVLLLVPAMLKLNEYKIQSAALQSDLASAIREVNQRQIILEQDAEIQKTIDALNEDTQKTRREIELLAGKGELYPMIEAITGNLPMDASFKKISCDAKKITIDGLAANRSAVILYAHILEKTQKFSSVRISLIDESSEQTDEMQTVFRIVVER